MTELLFGTARKVLGISRKYARSAFEQHDAGVLGIDRMEFVFQYVARDFGQGAGELYASRASAHDHKIERRVPASFGGIAFRQLKGQQHAAANFDGVFDGFQPRCQRFPFIVSEISMAGSGGNDQIVVRNIAIAKLHYFPREIEILHLAKKHLHVAIAAENPEDGGGDFDRRQTRIRHLIEKRLIGMEIIAIDESYANRIARERSRGEQASETSANYNHMRTGIAVHWLLFI